MSDSPRARWAAPAATVLATFAVLGPLLVSGGIALRGDMVFTPDQPWKPAWLGLDGSVPRAVPMDALVSLVDEVIPGALLQRLLLIAAFLAGGLGIARLAGRFGAIAQVTAVLVYLWNPWVYERLAIGQWPTVLGYGLLPWLVLAAARARDGRAGGWPATILLLLLSGVCAPSVGLVGALVAIAVVAVGREWSRVLAALGTALMANLPWMAPAVLGPGLRGSESQFDDFAARGESSLGTLASLLSMGGIWKSSVVPPERSQVIVIAVAALLALGFAAAFRYAVPALGRDTAAGVAGVGTASLLLSLLPSIGPVGNALGSLSADWPALGILRDSQRYLAPMGLVLAVGAAALVDRLISAARSGQAAQGATAVLVALAPVLLLPSLLWGLAGQMRPASYPDDWSRVAEVVAGEDGATVVLPWRGGYRRYGWNDRRAGLDPAARFLPGDVLVDDRTFLGERALAGEDPFLARVETALAAPDPAGELRELGARWVLVEEGQGVRAADVPAGAVAYDGRWLTLIDLGLPDARVEDLRDAPIAWVVMLCDIATGFAGCVSFWQLARLLVRIHRNPV